MGDDHIRRPDPERENPFRQVGNLWSSVGAPPQGDERPGRGEDWPDERRDARAEFVADGVRSAYRVIDEYLHQGRRVARQIGSLSYGPLKLGASSPDVQARWVQVTSDLIANWFDLLGLLSDTLTPTFEEPPYRDTPGSEEATRQASPVHVSLEVASRRPALVDVHFQPGFETVNVTSHGLRKLGEADAIPVEFDAPDHLSLIVRVAVPDDCEPGQYSGVLLVPETGNPVGTLSLTLR